MVSFAPEKKKQMDERQDGARKRPLQAGFVRSARSSWTDLDMIIGMVQMAMGFGEGGEQKRGLGTAVNGGLTSPLLPTLFLCPAFLRGFTGRTGGEKSAFQRPAVDMICGNESNKRIKL